MLRLVFCALGNSVRSKKFLTAVIFSAVAAMLFCVNVTVGYGENRYHSMKNGNNYTALTVSDLDGNAAGTDMIPYLREKLSLDIGAALYVTGLEDGSLPSPRPNRRRRDRVGEHVLFGRRSFRESSFSRTLIRKAFHTE